ncbi:hypothetical protein DU86_11245 [Methanosarcina mazei]|uniref:Uncharacterized protein n=1 Tax=Methanosarcina mazei TaxID=2209 RepID=A0A0F8FFG9_METMZ|nr:hypothetical protein DU31_10220 [Methanosarcina mazei]KKG25703.1 hypothetical protein DU52_01450 [Methanosarcina mazei]KKG36618.1 hypothetical protein DU30_15200 [Methanosarcina mazei]KKH34848.1 hypothetical protein DU54_10170 [Methanosarcina mazei]KKH39157.1 hypothetical protein DU50_11145 [Methanosarcina mazei]
MYILKSILFMQRVFNKILSYILICKRAIINGLSLKINVKSNKQFINKQFINIFLHGMKNTTLENKL